MSAIRGAMPATPCLRPTWRKSVPKPLRLALAPRHLPASLSKDESNIKHSANDIQHPKMARMAPWLFDVGCWMLDVFCLGRGNPTGNGVRLQRRLPTDVPLIDRPD